MTELTFFRSLKNTVYVRKMTENSSTHRAKSSTHIQAHSARSQARASNVISRRNPMLLKLSVTKRDAINAAVNSALVITRRKMEVYGYVLAFFSRADVDQRLQATFSCSDVEASKLAHSSHVVQFSKDFRNSAFRFLGLDEFQCRQHRDNESW